MRILLVPTPPGANISFVHTLPDPKHDEDKRCPTSWAAQQQMLEAFQEEGVDLESPGDIHAFDKAAWHTALLVDVIFNLGERSVTCKFVDGSTATWCLSSTGAHAACIAELESIIQDVQDATTEDRNRLEGHTSSFHTASSIPSPPASPVSASLHKAHKRQKSLFSSIVAAVKGALSDNANRGHTLPTSHPPLKISTAVPSHSRTPSTFSRTQRSPPMSPAIDEEEPFPPPFQLVIRPREPIPLPPHARVRTRSEILRRRARSGLVDLFRRHVVSMFSLTGSPSFAEVQSAPDWYAQTFGFPPGLYPAWAARSMLRKVEDRMRNLIGEANARGLGHALECARNHRRVTLPLRDLDDEDDDNSATTVASASTETDGSSVHTPLDSPVRSPFAPAIVSSSGGISRFSSEPEKAAPQVPRSPSPPSPTYDFDMSTYHQLTSRRGRLLAILTKLGSSPRQMISGHQHSSDLTILEIKSRRRAWSARDFVGGARMSLVGLATPFRRSPLARCEPVTAEMVSHLESQEGERSSLSASRSLVGLSDLSAEFGIKPVTKEMDARLFPVCEEDEDEEPRAVVYQSGYGLDEYIEDEGWRSMHEFDLESGLMVFPRPESAESSQQAHSPMHPMVRTRTQSMRKEHSRTPSDVLSHQRTSLARGEGTLSSNSLLCQPLKVSVPVMLDGEDSFHDEKRGGEFTLAMDLPSPPRGWDRSCR